MVKSTTCTRRPYNVAGPSSPERPARLRPSLRKECHVAARNLAWATLLGVVGLAAQGGARFLHTTWVGNTAPDRLGT